MQMQSGADGREVCHRTCAPRATRLTHLVLAAGVHLLSLCFINGHLVMAALLLLRASQRFSMSSACVVHSVGHWSLAGPSACIS